MCGCPFSGRPIFRSVVLAQHASACPRVPGASAVVRLLCLFFPIVPPRSFLVRVASISSTSLQSPVLLLRFGYRRSSSAFSLPVVFPRRFCMSLGMFIHRSMLFFVQCFFCASEGTCNSLGSGIYALAETYI